MLNFNNDPTMTTNASRAGCPHCSGNGVTIYHSGKCPKIKAIEYYPDGSIKRIEYVREALNHD